MKKKQTYEQAMARLEEITQMLESDETPLDEGIALYKESMGLVQFCTEKLDYLEGEVALLRKTLDGNFKKDNWVED